jgi:dephospho-CoA kinase
MLKVGLTGGIACGKTTVGEMFVSLGAHLIKADDIGHDLMQPGLPVYEAIVSKFGREILNPDQTINRARLADAVFPSGRIAELNAIVHPAVIAAQESWMEDVFHKDPSAVAIVEAALILESGSWKRFDRLITVACRFEQKVERFAARHHLSLDVARAEVERRQKAQASDEEKIKVSQYVIDNSGTLEETRGQVERIWLGLQGTREASARR